MSGERLHVTVLVAIVVTVVTGAVGVQGQPTADATIDRVTRQSGCIDGEMSQPCHQPSLSGVTVPSAARQLPQELPPNGTGQGPAPSTMSTTVSRTGSNSFSVAVRNARNGRSTTVEPPSAVGDADDDTDLRSFDVVSRGGASRFDLNFTVDSTLESLSAADASSPPAAFDTPLLYSTVDSTASSNDFGITYRFDVETDYLREANAGQNDVVVSVYRGGEWQTVDATPGQQSGNEMIVRTSIAGPGLVAVGLRHPEISVVDVRPQNPPALSNRTSRLELTLENSGSRDGTETFNVTADDRTIASPTVSVAAGTQRTVTVPVQFQKAGETDVEVGEYDTELTVTEPTPDISVTALSVDRNRIETGETVTVDATVTNAGTAGGTGSVQFRAFGDVVTVDQVKLAPGETRTVQFTQQFDAPGEYRLGVNNRTTTVTVDRGPNWESTPAEDSGTVTAGDGESESDSSFQWALILLGAGVVLMFGLVTVGRMLRD